MCERNVTKGADVMGCIENHLNDKGIVHAGFLSNSLLIHNKLREIILSTRLVMCYSSLSSEDKDKYFKKCRNTDNGIIICTVFMVWVLMFLVLNLFCMIGPHSQ